MTIINKITSYIFNKKPTKTLKHINTSFTYLSKADQKNRLKNKLKIACDKNFENTNPIIVMSHVTPEYTDLEKLSNIVSDNKQFIQDISFLYNVNIVELNMNIMDASFEDKQIPYSIVIDKNIIHNYIKTYGKLHYDDSKKEVLDMFLSRVTKNKNANTFQFITLINYNELSQELKSYLNELSIIKNKIDIIHFY